MAAAHPAFANIAYLRIPRFDDLAVGEQATLKEALEARTRTAISGLQAADWIALDAHDGLALVMFGDPARALRIAQALQGAGGELRVQAGLNYGPLALSQGGEARVMGDGLSSAAAAARFASPEKLLVTQDFARALERQDPAKAAELAGAGDFTDTRVRRHLLFTPDAGRRNAYRRRMLAYGVLGVAAILALGFAAREAAKRLFPPPPAIVVLDVRPRGEVYVDGVYRGRIPPLRQVEVAAGRHVFEVRAAGLVPFETTLEVKPGEQATITHTFARPVAPGKPAPRGEPGFWEGLRKSLGGG
ncbi:MAG TPA: PEGA domain-containing protein [Usitatibacter sp.]|nr:PEGA domain-containing protein [Usitatibacter sp.]